MLDEILEEYSCKYINSDTNIKSGYCKRCLNEKWQDSTEIKKLYEYTYPKTKELIYICKKHIGCMEVAKELAGGYRNKNDIERHKTRKELGQLIDEGVNLLQI